MIRRLFNKNFFEAIFAASCEGVAGAWASIHYPGNYLLAGIACGGGAIVAFLIFKILKYLLNINQTEFVETTHKASVKGVLTPTPSKSRLDYWYYYEKTRGICLTLFILVGVIFTVLIYMRLPEFFGKDYTMGFSIGYVFILFPFGIFAGWAWANTVSGVITHRFGPQNKPYNNEDDKNSTDWIIPIVILTALIDWYLITHNCDIFVVLWFSYLGSIMALIVLPDWLNYSNW